MQQITLPTADQFLASVENDARLIATAARKGLDTAVPTCPGWTMRDLLVHTGVIYLRKEQVVLNDLADRETRVDKPAGDPINWFEEATTVMLAALRSKQPGDHSWTWFAPDQTVGFWQRRMAHETLIHRIDAELAHGDVNNIDPVIAEDGIDEALNVFVAGNPGWTTLERGNGVIRLSTGVRSWLLQTASYSGTTRSGKVLSHIPAVLLEPGVESWDCEISGSPVELDLWLWGRGPITNLDVTGANNLADYLRDVASKST